MRTFKQIDTADLKSINEVDYVCSWHKEDPKEDAALTAWRIQQQQPWWIQPHMGLYDVNDPCHAIMADTAQQCTKPTPMQEVLALFRTGLPEWLSLFRSGAAPIEEEEASEEEEGCELEDLMQLLMGAPTHTKAEPASQPSPLVLGAAAEAV